MTRELGYPLKWQSSFLAALAGALLASWGCCAGPRTHPVRGKVLYRGQPAVGARVVFHPKHDPEPQAPHPAGVVAEDGSFTLTSYKAGDGALAGDYTVAVVWPEETARTARNRGRVSKQPADRLRGAYSNPARPLLQAHVAEGDNELPAFELR